MQKQIQSNQKKSPLLIVYLVLALMYLQVLMPVFSEYHSLIAAQNQVCTDALDQAEEYYYEGKFDQTIDLVMQCLKMTKDNTVKVRAYTILLKTFIAKDNTKSAKEMVNKILDINANYTPTLEQERPGLVNLVVEVKKERETSQKTVKPKESGSNTWLWIGAGGVVVIGAVALLALGGGGDEKPEEQSNTLSTPPAFP
ncbi:hypothetical protein ACFLSX_05010 [Calditrichota bacterium]